MENKYHGGLESLAAQYFEGDFPQPEVRFISFREALRSTKYSVLAKVMIPFVWLFLRVKRSYYGPVNLSDKPSNIPILVHMSLAGLVTAEEVIRYDTTQYLSYNTLQKFLKYRKEGSHLVDITTLPKYPKGYKFNPEKDIRLVLPYTAIERPVSPHSLKSRANTWRRLGSEAHAKRLEDSVARKKEVPAEEPVPVKCEAVEAFINEGEIALPNHSWPALHQTFNEEK